MWDFHIQIDHVIEAPRPDLVVLYKKKKSCKIIDFAVPGDSAIEEKEKDKIEKYQDLGSDLQKKWNVKVKIITLVVDSLGAIPKLFDNRLKQIGITAETAQVGKTVLLGTARILRKVLGIYATGCGRISSVFCSIALQCVRSIIMMMMMMIIKIIIIIPNQCFLQLLWHMLFMIESWSNIKKTIYS